MKASLATLVVALAFVGSFIHAQSAYTARTVLERGVLCTACWDRVAYCESTGRWNIATGNGYYGGLQFTLSSWRAYGGLRFASMPHYATRIQQMTVASRMSLGNWPVCGSRYYG